MRFIKRAMTSPFTGGPPHRHSGRRRKLRRWKTDWSPSSMMFSLACQHLFSFLLQLDVDRFGRTVTVDNAEAISGLQALKLIGHQPLVFEKAVEHVARQAQVHSALPVIQCEILREVPLDEDLGGHF